MSNLKFAADIRSYADAEEFLGDKSRRKLCYETYVQCNADGIAVYHHDTAIVTYYADGKIRLDNGGWNSSTTTNRMHKLTPDHIVVNLRQGVMYVHHSEGMVSDLVARALVIR